MHVVSSAIAITTKLFMAVFLLPPNCLAEAAGMADHNTKAHSHLSVFS